MSERLRILQGDVIEQLRTLQDASVHCCVTSPPYHSLRDYGTAIWEGGDPSCEHTRGASQAQGKTGQRADRTFTAQQPYKDTCGKCGSVRVDRQIGLEARLDCLGWATGSPCNECWVCKMVAVFREIKRVLRPDGVCWVNLGDSYAGCGNSGKETAGEARSLGKRRLDNIANSSELSAKNLCGQPWRFALAAQADGWYLRSDIIWAKKNPMPESVIDRPTKAHEYLFMLTKSQRYYYDADAVREITGNEMGIGEYAARLELRARFGPSGVLAYAGSEKHDGGKSHSNGRNMRDVWFIASEPMADAHFATYPTALVKPCILASTSEKGCCPKCGAGWVRVVEKYGGKIQPNEYAVKAAQGALSGGMNRNRLNGNQQSSISIGWKPGCKCKHEEADVVPATVLDPFLGSGTTALVALNYNRHAIGIELNPDYICIAEKRLEGPLSQIWLQF